MRLRTLARQKSGLAYEVECRHHEHPAWITESSRCTELVYPVLGGFLLDDGESRSVCLPARLTMIPGGARYRVRHFTRLPDRTLVIILREPPCTPSGIAHRFLSATEAIGLQLLAYSLRSGVAAAEAPLAPVGAWLSELTGAVSTTAPRFAGLERALAELLRTGPTALPADCARAADLGVDEYRHRFRKAYGVTPHAVVRTLRLARALQAMLEGGTATTAAGVCGFTHLSHLSGEFRRLAGCSPRALLASFRGSNTHEQVGKWLNS